MSNNADLPQIFAFAPNDWIGSPKNRQQLLSRLAQMGWPVIYSTGALSVWQRNDVAWKSASIRGGFFRDGNVVIDRAGRVFPRWQTLRYWDRFAIRHHIQRLTRKVALGTRRKKIAFLFHPVFWPYVEELDPDYVVFHAYDAFRMMDHDWSSEHDRQMWQLTTRADLLSATTVGVIATFPEEARAKARLLENGANVEMFRAAIGQPDPSELASVPHPRIGYVGTINRRIDFKAINHVARRHPEWHWVLLGHLSERTIFPDDEARAGYLEARTLPNVHWFSEVPPSTVSAYAAHMDVNTICYRIHDDEWISAGYPVKLHEYLAIGKPVISAPIDIVKKNFTSVVRIASSADEWEAAIAEALNRGGVGTPATRQAVAAENTWDQRAALLDTWLSQMIGRPRT